MLHTELTARLISISRRYENPHHLICSILSSENLLRKSDDVGEIVLIDHVGMNPVYMNQRRAN